MLREAERVKIDLLEQMEEYQEEVNSHKQALQSLEDKFTTEIEELKNQVTNFQATEDDFMIQIQNLEQSLADT